METSIAINNTFIIIKAYLYIIHVVIKVTNIFIIYIIIISARLGRERMGTQLLY